MSAIQSIASARRTRRIIAFFLAALSLSCGAVAWLHPKDEWPLSSIKLRLYFGLHPSLVLPNPSIQNSPQSTVLLAKLAKILAQRNDPRAQEASVLITEEVLRQLHAELQSKPASQLSPEPDLCIGQAEKIEALRASLLLFLNSHSSLYVRGQSARNLGLTIALTGDLTGDPDYTAYIHFVRHIMPHCEDLVLILAFWEGLRAHSNPEIQSLTSDFERAVIRDWNDWNEPVSEQELARLQLFHRSRQDLCSRACPIPSSRPICFLRHLESQSKSQSNTPNSLIQLLIEKIQKTTKTTDCPANCNFCRQTCAESDRPPLSRLSRTELLHKSPDGHRLRGIRVASERSFLFEDILTVLLPILFLLAVSAVLYQFFKLAAIRQDPAATGHTTMPGFHPSHWNMGGPAFF